MYSMVVKYKDDTEWTSKNYNSTEEAMSLFLTTNQLRRDIKEVTIKEQD